MKKALIFFAAAMFTLAPLGASSVKVASPNGGESWAPNTAHDITWTYSNPGSIVVNITLRHLNGGLVGPIQRGVVLSSGVLHWTVGRLEDGTMAPAASDYIIRIRDAAGAVGDDSDAAFAITGTAPPPQPSITVTNPNYGSEYIIQGHIQWIEWTAINIGQNVRIVLTTPDGADVGVIAENVAPNSSPYYWTAGQTQSGTAPAGASYKVRVSTMDGSVHDDSDNPFLIHPAAPVIIKVPPYDRPPSLFSLPKLAVTAIDLLPNPEAYFIVFGFKNAGNAPLPPAADLPQKPDFKVVIDGREVSRGDLNVPADGLAPGAEVKEALGGFIKFPAAGDPWPFCIGDQITITLNERNVLGMGTATKTSSLRLIALHNFYDLALVPVTCDWNAGVARLIVTKVGGGSPPSSKKFILYGTIHGYQPPGSVPHKWYEGVVESPGPFTISKSWTILSTDQFPVHIDIPLAEFSPFYEFEFVIKPEFRDEFDERNNSLPLVRFDRPN